MKKVYFQCGTPITNTITDSCCLKNNEMKVLHITVLYDTILKQSLPKCNSNSKKTVLSCNITNLFS